MLIKAQFKIDLIQLKHTPDKEGLLNLHKEQAARELGAEIVKHFPFVRNEEGSYKGEVPEVSMNRDHEFTDLYETRLVVLAEADIKETDKLDPIEKATLKNLFKKLYGGNMHGGL